MFDAWSPPSIRSIILGSMRRAPVHSIHRICSRTSSCGRGAASGTFAISIGFLHEPGRCEFLDGDYMRLHIALEGFAYALLKTDDEERVDVKDRKAWKSWVKQNQLVILNMASMAGRDAALQQSHSMRRACLQEGSFPLHSSERGLSLTDDMRKELRGRDDVIHQG